MDITSKKETILVYFYHEKVYHLWKKNKNYQMGPQSCFGPKKFTFKEKTNLNIV